jgi:hypothetical protein
MQVYIANFGRANFLWPECQDTGTIAVLDDEETHARGSGIIQTAGVDRVGGVG